MCVLSVLTSISENIMSAFLLLYHCGVKICFLDLNVFLDQLQSYSNGRSRTLYKCVGTLNWGNWDNLHCHENRQ